MNPVLHSCRHRRRRVVPTVLTLAGLAEIILIRLGRTYGSTKLEQATPHPGDDIVANPAVVTNHAITISASPDRVWPWLTQMGWHKGGWYTARWVDRLLFPANWPSATRLIPDWQNIEVGSFIPDGAPETQCGFIVEHLDPARTLVLHSTSHLPASWRENGRAAVGLVVDVHPDTGRRGPQYALPVPLALDHRSVVVHPVRLARHRAGRLHHGPEHADRSQGPGGSLRS